MAAQYDFQRRPNPKGDGELQPLYPRIVNKGTIEMERLVQDIADMSECPVSVPVTSMVCWRQ